MKQLVSMIWIDVRLSFKSYVGFFMLIVPLIILLVLNFFIPTVENAGASFAVVTEGPNAVDSAVIAELDQYGTVSEYATIEAMNNRLRGAGQAEGLYWDPAAEQYVSVMERSLSSENVFSTAARIIRQQYQTETYPDAPAPIEFSWFVPEELSERTINPPVATVGGAIYIVYLTILTAFMIGMGIVNDKEYGTDKAYKVTPLTRLEYFIAKSIYPMIVLLVYSGVGLVVLGLTNTNIAQVYVAVFLSYLVSLVVALFVGAITKNENEAIGVIKLIGMVMAMGILGGTLLPENWQWAAWWIPFYWVYDLLEGVFTLSETWGSVGWKSAVILALGALYFLLTRKKIAEGLS